MNFLNATEISTSQEGQPTSTPLQGQPTSTPLQGQSKSTLKSSGSHYGYGVRSFAGHMMNAAINFPELVNNDHDNTIMSKLATHFNEKKDMADMSKDRADMSKDRADMSKDRADMSREGLDRNTDKMMATISQLEAAFFASPTTHSKFEEQQAERRNIDLAEMIKKRNQLYDKVKNEMDPVAIRENMSPAEKAEYFKERDREYYNKLLKEGEKEMKEAKDKAMS
jgi:hypothetical protein